MPKGIPRIAMSAAKLSRSVSKGKSRKVPDVVPGGWIKFWVIAFYFSDETGGSGRRFLLGDAKDAMRRYHIDNFDKACDIGTIQVTTR